MVDSRSVRDLAAEFYRRRCGVVALDVMAFETPQDVAVTLLAVSVFNFVCIWLGCRLFRVGSNIKWMWGSLRLGVLGATALLAESRPGLALSAAGLSIGWELVPGVIGEAQAKRWIAVSYLAVFLVGQFLLAGFYQLIALDLFPDGIALEFIGSASWFTA